MSPLLFALLLLLASFPSFCYAWTESEWLGFIEATTGISVLRATNTPSSDSCDNCGGTGKLGDGTVSVECPVCEGTGRPVQPGKYKSTQQDCASCAVTGTIEPSPSPSGMDAPAVKQEAASSGGGNYKTRLFRRR